MVRNIFTALTFASFLTACGQKTEAPTVVAAAPELVTASSKELPAKQQATVSPSNADEIPLEFPQPFDMGAGQSLKDYKGLDSFKFLTMYKSKLNVSKGDFESSAEFSKRKSNTEALLKPISLKALYAFRLSNFRATYDADTKSYKSDFDCQVKDKNARMFCLVNISSDDDVSYMAQNGYGAKVEVNRKIAYFLNLSIKDNSPFFKKKQGMSPAYRFIDLKLPVSIEKAQSLQNHALSMLLIGQIDGTGVVDAGSSYQAPTRVNPMELVYSSVAIPFALKKAVFYDMSTGEILLERTF